MNSTDVLDVLREAMIVTIKIAAPAMLVTLVVGLVISVLQTLTQIQEATLTFVPKILVVFGTLVLVMPFMLSTLITFTQALADRIIGLGTGF